MPVRQQGVKKALEDLEKLPSDASLEKISANPVLKHLVDEGKMRGWKRSGARSRHSRRWIPASHRNRPAATRRTPPPSVPLWHTDRRPPPPPADQLFDDPAFCGKEQRPADAQVNRRQAADPAQTGQLASMRDEVSFLVNAGEGQAGLCRHGLLPLPAGPINVRGMGKASMVCRHLIAQRLISVLNAMTFGEAQQKRSTTW